MSARRGPSRPARVRGASGQTMVEFALAASLFLLLVMGLLQVALLALADAGADADVLEGARLASGSVAAAYPLADLGSGRAELAQLLPMALFGSRIVTACPGCGLPLTCTRYRDGKAVPSSARPCRPGPLPGGAGGGFGPAPAELDGPQDPACTTGTCFGVGAAMRSCRLPAPPGVIHVCLTYADWPATAVDVWVRGSLRPLVPMPFGLGRDRLPIDAHIRLQVEQLTA